MRVATAGHGAAAAAAAAGNGAAGTGQDSPLKEQQTATEIP